MEKKLFMDFIDSRYITNFLLGLNQANIEYVLIKNIANELPEHLENGKDIDICVREKDMSKLEDVMLSMGFVQLVHPQGMKSGWSFFYGLPEHQFWKLDCCPYDIHADISFKLSCLSLTQCAWVPLDSFIQKYMWDNKVWEEKNNWWIMDINSRFAYYFVRCIFDKKTFSDKYIYEIENSKSLIDINIVSSLLEKVFFKFTEKLLELVEEQKYQEIIMEYKRFKDY